MTGLRRVRQRLQAIRHELRADGSLNRIVTIEAGANVDESAVESFLDRELGEARDHCFVVRLLRFSESTPPRIIRDQPYGGRP